MQERGMVLQTCSFKKCRKLGLGFRNFRCKHIRVAMFTNFVKGGSLDAAYIQVYTHTYIYIYV